jgi:hypothetical protein
VTEKLVPGETLYPTKTALPEECPPAPPAVGTFPLVPGLPEPPPPTIAIATVLLPAGIVKLPEELNVCESAYANETATLLDAADAADWPFA